MNLTKILDKLIKRLEDDDYLNDVVMTSHAIHMITLSLSKISYVIPKLCELMLAYVNENSDVVCGITVARLLHYLFSMGYEPQGHFATNQIADGSENSGIAAKQLNAELFDFEKFAAIINRDFDYMHGLLILQACLALSFYQALPVDMITRIFDMDFIVRLEKEMAYYSDGVSFRERIVI